MTPNFIAALLRGAWNPQALFRSGEQGAIYDPSDYGTMWQESTGVTPVTAPETVVGLLLDKRLGAKVSTDAGNHVHQPTAASRPVLSARKNFISNSEDFSRSTWPTFHTKGSLGRVEELPAEGVHYLYEIVSTLASTNTTLSCDFKRDQRDIVWMYIGSSANAQVVFNLLTGVVSSVTGAATPTATITPLGDGWYRCTISALAPAGSNCGFGLSNSTTIASYLGVAGQGVFVDRFQAERGLVATSYQRSGSRNLLTRTEDISNSIWAKNGVTILSPTSATYVSTGYVLQVVTAYPAVIGETFSFSVDTNHPNPGSVTYGGASPSGTDVQTTEVLGGGMYRHTATRTFTATATGSLQCLFYGGVAGSGTYTCTRMHGEKGPRTPYQRVDVVTNNYDWAFPHYLKFDGVDDCLFTPGNVDFSGTDKGLLAAGVTKLGEANYGIIAELSASLDTNVGTFNLYNNIGPNITARSRGSTGTGTVSSSRPAPYSGVLTGTGSISASSAALRVDGVQAGNDVTSQGAGNYGSYPLYVGRRGNATYPFNGNIYSLVIRGGPSTLAQTTAVERFLARKSGVTLT